MVHKRAFLVGCPRSGTTILQRCISCHSEIGSFPETDFFAKLIGKGKGKWLTRVNFVGRERRDRAWDKMGRVFGQELTRPDSQRYLRLDRSISHYVDFLDSLAKEKGYSVWIEKTPYHFRYIETIERNVPESVFIHTIRDGRAVVGSIVDRALRYPENFGDERNPMDAVRLWNEAVSCAVNRIHRSGDLAIHHDDLVTDPHRVLKKICERLDVEYEPTMVKGGPSEDIMGVDEKWKESVEHGVSKVENKFEEVLSESDRVRVNRMLDWSSYQRLLDSKEY